MRHLALVTLIAACGFPEPPDQCEGPCMLLSIDRPIANAMDEIWFEGTFVEGSQVQFPGKMGFQGLDGRFDHRAKVLVPPDVTSGDVRIVTVDGDNNIVTSSQPVPLRTASFKLGLQPFMAANEQGDYARTNLLDRVHVGGAAVTIGNRIYLIGGYSGNAVTGDVEVATTGLDGGVGRPKFVEALIAARAGHTVTRVGRYIYVIGGTGTGTMDSVERASIDSDGRLSAFENVNVKLNAGRTGHAAVVLGNFLYVLGGSNGGSDLGSLERARIIDEQGSLDAFETVAGIAMGTARSYFTVAYTGENLFVIGGMAGGTPTNSVERMHVSGSGYVDNFVQASHLVEARSNHVSVVLGDNVYVIGGRNAARTVTSVEVAPIVDQEALTFSAMLDNVRLNEPKQDAALAVVGNYVYLFGGRQMGTGNDSDSSYPERASIIEGGTLASFKENPTTLVVQRGDHASVVLGNKLYVIGGYSGTQIEQSVEVSTINPDGTLAGFGMAPGVSLTTARFGHSVLVDDNRLYVFGGLGDSNTHLRSVEAATIAEDGTLGAFVIVGPQMLVERRNFTMFAAGQYAFLMGGMTGTNDITTADVESVGFVNGVHNFFDEGYALRSVRAWPASIAIGNHLYVIGGTVALAIGSIDRAGIDGFGLSQDFEVDPNTLNMPRYGHRAVLVGTKLYVIGGSDFMMMPPIETADVVGDGLLQNFQVSTLALVRSRMRHTIVTLGNYVYVIGGDVDGSNQMRTIETATIE